MVRLRGLPMAGITWRLFIALINRIAFGIYAINGEAAFIKANQVFFGGAVMEPAAFVQDCAPGIVGVLRRLMAATATAGEAQST